jgi:hypothetical protein
MSVRVCNLTVIVDPGTKDLIRPFRLSPRDNTNSYLTTSDGFFIIILQIRHTSGHDMSRKFVH